MKKFRNCLFGFNRDDVLNFVVEARESELKHKKTIDALNSKINELEAASNELSEKNAALDSELSSALLKIKDFEQREEALTRLSESIGRLYLVAQANASSIIASANENVKKANAVVDHNMSVATEAEAELQEISRVLNEKTAEYAKEIDALKQQLTEARDRIAENKAEISDRQSELEAISVGAE